MCVCAVPVRSCAVSCETSAGSRSWIWPSRTGTDTSCRWGWSVCSGSSRCSVCPPPNLVSPGPQRPAPQWLKMKTDKCSLGWYIRYTLTGHFIRYILLVSGWTHFCLQNCFNSSWRRFNKVLETFLRDFGPYCHDSITQFLQICRLHIHDVNLSFHHIPKVLYWIEIWWLWRPFE